MNVVSQSNISKEPSEQTFGKGHEIFDFEKSQVQPEAEEIPDCSSSDSSKLIEKSKKNNFQISIANEPTDFNPESELKYTHEQLLDSRKLTSEDMY